MRREHKWKPERRKKGGGKKTLRSVSHLAEIKNSSLRLVRRYLGWFAKLSMQIARWLVVVLDWWNRGGVRTLRPSRPITAACSTGWRPVCTAMSLSRKWRALPHTHADLLRQSEGITWLSSLCFPSCLCPCHPLTQDLMKSKAGNTSIH